MSDKQKRLLIKSWENIDPSKTLHKNDIPSEKNQNDFVLLGPEYFTSKANKENLVSKKKEVLLLRPADFKSKPEIKKSINSAIYEHRPFTSQNMYQPEVLSILSEIPSNNTEMNHQKSSPDKKDDSLQNISFGAEIIDNQEIEMSPDDNQTKLKLNDVAMLDSKESRINSVKSQPDFDKLDQLGRECKDQNELIEKIKVLYPEPSSAIWTICNMLSKIENKGLKSKDHAVAVYWDLENHIGSSSKSLTPVIELIREKFCKNYREVEFLATCDVWLENENLLDEINDCNVNISHVDHRSTNVAEHVIRSEMYKKAEMFRSDIDIVLITGDINFLPDIYDLRNQFNSRVILIHPKDAEDKLIRSANEAYVFSNFNSELPTEQATCSQKNNEYVELLVEGVNKEVKYSLSKSFNKFGAKLKMFAPPLAVYQMRDRYLAKRAAKRFDKHNFNGTVITVGLVKGGRSINEE